MGSDQKDTKTILVIEDDRSLREGLAINLKKQGYTVLCAEDGQEGLEKAFDTRPDLIVLDLMLPSIPGLEILEELRKQEMEVPVLILSARSQTPVKVEGLKLGADDYLTKPFELPELLARSVVIEALSRTVTRDGKAVSLLAKEFDLLHLLARHPGRAFSRDVILDRVWGWDFDGTARTVDNYIRALRKKLEAQPSHPRHILTIHQVGYQLILDD